MMNRVIAFSVLIALIPGLTHAADTVKNITVKKGAFNIPLELTPGTGYSWTIEKISPSIKFIRKLSLSAPTIPEGLKQITKKPVAGVFRQPLPTIGAPNRETWRFKALSSGQAQLVLKLSRPWEKGAPAKRVIYNITIE